MSNFEALTGEFRDFEIVAMNPSAYDEEELVHAFQKGNIALAEATKNAGEKAPAIAKALDEESIDPIGKELAKRAREHHK
jgi:hypothetical protein